MLLIIGGMEAILSTSIVDCDTKETFTIQWIMVNTFSKPFSQSCPNATIWCQCAETVTYRYVKITVKMNTSYLIICVNILSNFICEILQ